MALLTRPRQRVAAGPQAGGGDVEVEHPDTTRPARIPGERKTVDDVECDDALTRNRAGTGGVSHERVVHPPQVTADIGDSVVDLDGVTGVAAGVGDPGGREIAAWVWTGKREIVSHAVLAR